jgi:hypothetical protein
MQSFQGNDAAVKWNSISLHRSLARTSYRFEYRFKESIFNFLAHPDSSLSDHVPMVMDKLKSMLNVPVLWVDQNQCCKADK